MSHIALAELEEYEEDGRMRLEYEDEIRLIEQDTSGVVPFRSRICASRMAKLEVIDVHSYSCLS